MTKILPSYSGNLVRLIDHPRYGSCVEKQYRRKPAFQREKICLELLDGSSVSTPKILEVGGDGYLLMTVVAGVPLNDDILGNRDDVASQLGSMLASLEMATIGKFPADDPTTLSRRSVASLRQAALRASSMLNVERIIATFGEHSHCIDLPGPSLVMNHRDVRLDNLLFDEATGRIGIIDFETACWGPPGCDLGRMFIEDFKDIHIQHRILEGYGQVSTPPPSANIAVFKLAYAVEMLGWFQTKGTSALSADERAFAQQLIHLANDLVR